MSHGVQPSFLFTAKHIIALLIHQLTSALNKTQLKTINTPTCFGTGVPFTVSLFKTKEYSPNTLM